MKVVYGYIYIYIAMLGECKRKWKLLFRVEGLGFTRTRDTFLGVPNKDYSILGFILGSWVPLI